MSSESNKVVKPDESQNSQQTVDQSRRSFAKVSAAVVPVMMTLANRSAWGGTNICTQSGFASFTNQNGRVSHSANHPNPLWKTPVNWAGTSAWPAGFGRATYTEHEHHKDSEHDKEQERKFKSDLWSGGQDLAWVQEWEKTHVFVLAKSVFPAVADANLTLLAALREDELLAYRVATALNNAVAAVPVYFLTDQATLADFEAFYSSCITI